MDVYSCSEQLDVAGAHILVVHVLHRSLGLSRRCESDPCLAAGASITLANDDTSRHDLKASEEAEDVIDR